jgi:hypothetical protein
LRNVIYEFAAAEIFTSFHGDGSLFGTEPSLAVLGKRYGPSLAFIASNRVLASEFQAVIDGFAKFSLYIDLTPDNINESELAIPPTPQSAKLVKVTFQFVPDPPTDIELSKDPFMAMIAPLRRRKYSMDPKYRPRFIRSMMAHIIDQGPRVLQIEAIADFCKRSNGLDKLHMQNFEFHCR